MPPAFEDSLRDAVDQTIVDHQSTVQEWLSDTPGAWGSLAGRCVLTCRESLGRSLTASERRLAWQQLWDRLTELRVARG